MEVNYEELELEKEYETKLECIRREQSLFVFVYLRVKAVDL